ncbi:SWIM zinc finger family protein [Peribacillus sp. SI8-4]|uniref:SWIM zinc finger family protein n=1 Tax=Peribacillus sp. SI8-4 TaxID=3048009 RepID=UPI002552F508|nr:SWIM zinc finger family protein [Peribacillus sp. SI8-4]
MERELLLVGERLAEFLEAGNPDDSDVVNQGLHLYRQGLVEIKEEVADTIAAEVQDVTRHKARLNLIFPQEGSCTCESRFICRHQLAVFFSAYSEHASVSDWLAEWKAPKMESASQALQQVKRASELLKQAEENSIILDKSYPSWKRFVEVTFSDHVEPHIGEPNYMIENHIQTYFKRLSSKAPMEREWKLLYQFVTKFCTLQLTLRMIQLHKSQTQTIRVFYALAVDLAEELHETVQPLSRQARPFAFDPFVFSIKEDVAKLLDGGFGLEYEKIDLYREIWSYLFSNSSWRREELERIKADIPDKYMGTTERTSYTLAAIHLSLLENQDSQAIGLLHELKKDACPYIFYWLNLLAESDRSRSIPFIEFIIANVQEFLAELSDYYQRVDFVRTFTTLVSSCCFKLKRTDLLEKFYRATLPHSYWNYANFLFEQGQYKKWVEMHIYSEISIDLISSESIKEVVSKEPELILPLYYHAVQEKVSLKNRPAYKQAVRYLKKMRTIYKKTKKEDSFERYILYVADSTKRLRAFQEELKRGKLIDV